MSDNGRATIQVAGGSILAMLYKHWQRLGGHTKPGSKENLCHFVRAIVIWLPLLWFLRQRLVWQIRPWMVAALGGYISLFFFFAGPMTSLSIAIAVILIAAGLLFLAVALSENIENWWKWSESADKIRKGAKAIGWGVWYLFIWLWGPAVLVYGGLKKWREKRPVSYWRTAHVVESVVTGLALTLIGLVLLAAGGWLVWLVWWLHKKYRIGWVILAVAAKPAVVVARPVRSVAVAAKDPTVGVFQLVWAWLVAVKRMVCPFIEIAGPEPATS